MTMVSPSRSPERIDLPASPVAKSSSSKFASSKAALEPMISSHTNEVPVRDGVSDSSPNPSVEFNSESVEVLRSEEYRQLFRLPHEEVLVQDFNCALQESILIQGHMYLFAHHVCFYANIFGFETKRIIPFDEVTSVKRAKTAGIFPNAIEIFAGGQKYFFASFLSRDEAFKLIHDGWSEHHKGSKATAKSQHLISEHGDEGSELKIEQGSDICNGQDATIRPAKAVVDTESLPSARAWSWKPEDMDAPKVAEDYTMVAEARFAIKVEEFFNFFFSDDAIGFHESFHRKCGDKELRFTLWQPQQQCGHSRNISFQHPIKIYFGAKFGSCQELQKFRVYRNSHLIIETSQEINDVPYGDYFTVEGLWDVRSDCSQLREGCILQVYINVAFSKRTVWKGKIVQSTVEECKEVYATWIDMAHELLKQKNLEKHEGNMMTNHGVPSEGQERNEECLGSQQKSSEHPGARRMSYKVDRNQRMKNIVQGQLRNASSIASFLRDFSVKLFKFLKNQGCISQVLMVAFAVILLMQVTILVLLSRPQYIHMTPPSDISVSSGRGFSDRSAGSIAWMEKRIYYLKDEMLMVEERLERMWHEHAVLKAQFKDLEHYQKQR